jgi:hypothetical protein
VSTVRKKSLQGGNVPKIIGITFTPFPHSPRLLLSFCLSCVHLSQPAEMHTQLTTLVLHLLPGTRSATSLKQTAQAFKLESAVARADAHPRIHAPCDARSAVTSVLVLPSDPTFFLFRSRPWRLRIIPLSLFSIEFMVFAQIVATVEYLLAVRC